MWAFWLSHKELFHHRLFVQKIEEKKISLLPLRAAAELFFYYYYYFHYLINSIAAHREHKITKMTSISRVSHLNCERDCNIELFAAVIIRRRIYLWMWMHKHIEWQTVNKKNSNSQLDWRMRVRYTRHQCNAYTLYTYIDTNWQLNWNLC